ncbi:VOC family protein [Rufibacter glacialis]|uniref:VOC family protein n=1 Tax=Rufibacter glacialis TaxID=1259555 RepID=A0A5M8QA15_9BACT|nr:VOC family protein [Rufibacter glacialis]KAA6431700.1 VOC family protein [Rufibacter glacialis]GGK82318.1 VOC family protein [Rufibacter glacialis]
MVTLHPYLNFNGNTEEAFTFYKSIFGGEFSALQRFKDTPEAARVPTHEKEKIMHIALPIGQGGMLMATDALESMGHSVTMGNNFHLSLSTQSEEEASALFQALSEGGKVLVPLEKMFWGDLFGMVKDRFQIKWMVSYTLPQTQPRPEMAAESTTV